MSEEETVQSASSSMCILSHPKDTKVLALFSELGIKLHVCLPVTGAEGES